MPMHMKAADPYNGPIAIVGDPPPPTIYRIGIGPILSGEWAL